MKLSEAMNIGMASRAAVNAEIVKANTPEWQNIVAAASLMPYIKGLSDAILSAAPLLDFSKCEVSKPVKRTMKDAERDLRRLSKNKR